MPPKGGNAKKESGRAKKAENEAKKQEQAAAERVCIVKSISTARSSFLTFRNNTGEKGGRQMG